MYEDATLRKYKYFLTARSASQCITTVTTHIQNNLVISPDLRMSNYFLTHIWHYRKVDCLKESGHLGVTRIFLYFYIK